MRCACSFRGGDQVLGWINAKHDRVDAVDGRIEPVTGSHVTDDMFDIGAVAVPPSPAQNAHVSAGGHQTVDHNTPYSAGAAGYQ
jgi:hypothetical protein